MLVLRLHHIQWHYSPYGLCDVQGFTTPLYVLHTILPLAPLGSLPPPHLLSSVSLSTGGKITTPVTTFTQQPSGTSGTIAPTNLPGANALLLQQANNPGLVLSPAAEPFPRKLVEKVNSGQFVEMRELLADNIALLYQLEAIHGYSPFHLVGAARPRLRDVASLTTWCYCFLGYMAIRTSDPSTRDQLAYARLIIREALRHGGAGWIDYDRAFRQQAAVDPTLRWNTLLPGLQASTMLSHGTGQGALFCTLCREVDHTRAQCALLCLNPPTPRPPTTSTPVPRRKSDNICLSWNRGSCIFPGNCTYRHVCATCQLPHKARDCPRTLAYKQTRDPSQQSAAQPPPPPITHP